MTREEVQKLLMGITATFPNFHVEDKTATIDTWLMLLEEYSYIDIQLAFKSYVRSNNSGFAPSVSQLIHEIDKPQELATMSDSQAWSIVRLAIGRSVYNSKEEFEKLPPVIQRAVGSAEQLHYWACDENYNDGVVMSLFQRNYREVCKRQTEFRKLPTEMQLRIEQFIDNCPKIEGGALLIGNNEMQTKAENEEPLGTYAKRVEELMK